MDEVGLPVVVGLKPFITVEIEKLGVEADTVTGRSWLDPFLVS